MEVPSMGGARPYLCYASRTGDQNEVNGPEELAFNRDK